MPENKRKSLIRVLLSIGSPLAVLACVSVLFVSPRVFIAASATVGGALVDTGISVDQQVVPNPLQSGEVATYSLQVMNNSTFALPAVISNTLPAQVSPTGVVTWTAVISPNVTWIQPVVVTPTANYQGPIVNELQVSVPTSWGENLSYCTTCAEEDNINIPLYGDNVSHFRIIATHPAYNFTVDNCAADFSGCNLASSTPHDVTCDPLWDDGINVITVCNDSDWWLPQAMTVTVGSENLAGHRLVWNRKIADEASWPEVLVFYHDGNLRLKPQPPLGRADVCFGSSVVVGPAPADELRPYVEIETIVVDPAGMTLDVTYRNEESAHLELAVDRDQAQVDVWADYDTAVSFATFRSMYVAEDNADAARVKTAVGDFALLDISSPEWTTAWEALSGPRWFFYRQAVSNHNTSAPDISIEALDSYITYTAGLMSCINKCRIHLPIIFKGHPMPGDPQLPSPPLQENR